MIDRTHDLPISRQAKVLNISREAGRGFAGARTTIDRLDSHAFHQGRDMPATDREAFAAEKIAQHAGPRERALQMQFVHPPHEAQVFGRDRTRLVIDRAPRLLQSSTPPFGP
jgi:hypothetical protein